MKLQNCALKQYYLGCLGHFVFSDAPTTDRFWLRRKSGATLKAIMSQHSIPSSSSVSVTRLSCCYLNKQILYHHALQRDNNFLSIWSQSPSLLPFSEWTGGEHSWLKERCLVSCSIATLMDSLASRDDGFISNHLQQTHAGTRTHVHPHSKQEVMWACRAE